MEKKAIRVAYGEALVKLGETNENVVVLDADLAGATMTNGFKKAFPDREIIPVDCLTLILQHGSLHCSTMQYPTF